ncbi:hypothetical protein D3M70_00980 [Pseudomonas sp. LS-2]|nr:hypothetical protein D3M70_00980 [Pseudomonas sp. LS-2]
MLLVWPDFVGFPHSGDAAWARRHPPSMAGGGSRGIHAARPTERCRSEGTLTKEAPNREPGHLVTWCPFK